VVNVLQKTGKQVDMRCCTGLYGIAAGLCVGFSSRKGTDRGIL